MDVTFDQLAKLSIDFLKNGDTTAESSGILGVLIYELIKDCGGDHDEFMNLLTDKVLADLKESLAGKDDEDE